MSWLPVARRPAVSQVSMIRQSDALIQVITISGPVGPADIVSPLKTMLAGASQWQWWQLLTNAHRPADAVPILHLEGTAARSEDAVDHHVGRTADLASPLLRQERLEHACDAAVQCAPCRRTVVAGDLLHHVEDGDRIRLQTSELARPTQAEEAGLGQRLRGRRREPPVSLAPVGVLPNQRTERCCRADERVPRCTGGVGLPGGGLCRDVCSWVSGGQFAALSGSATEGGKYGSVLGVAARSAETFLRGRRGPQVRVLYLATLSPPRWRKMTV